MTDVQELQRYIRLLEARAEADGRVNKVIAELGDRINAALDEVFEDLSTQIGQVIDKLDEMTRALNKLTDAGAESPKPNLKITPIEYPT
jgi:hypothetical protein